MPSFDRPTDYPWSPTGTTGLQKAFAISIRKAFRDRLREIYLYLDKRENRLTEGLRLKSAVDPVTLAGISTILENLRFDLSPIVMSYVGASFWKANEEAAKKMNFKSWVPFDKRVLKAIQDESYSFLDKFIQKEHKDLKQILNEGISQGDTIKTITQDIKDNFKITSYKSELIARSETIKTYGRSTRMAIQNGGVTDKYRWFTSKKENVCPICRPLHGRIFNVHDKTAPMPVISTHPQCCISGKTKVLTDKGYVEIQKIKKGRKVMTVEGEHKTVTKIYRGEHTGKVTDIIFGANSKPVKLSITDEHPVLTKRGYVSAKDLLPEDEICIMLNQHSVANRPACKINKSFHEDGCIYIFSKPDQIIQRQLKHKVKTYNIEVEEFNNYIAKGIVLHNCNCGISPYVEV